MAVAVRHTDGTTASPDELERTWRERITQAREYRKPFEPIWLSNLDFAAGAQWKVYDPGTRTTRHISEVDARYADRELYTADKINEYVQAQLGELSTDDDRQELLLAQDGDTAEEIQKEINQAVAHAWDYEWGADQALKQARRLCLKLGTSAIWSRFDNTLGKVAKTVPVDKQGKPVNDPGTLDHLRSHGQLPDGSLPEFKQVREGRTVWHPVGAFGILTPPGVTHEDALPWEVIVRPVPLDQVLALYPHLMGLREDSDIGSVLGVTTAQASRGAQMAKSRLRGHVWLYTGFERPCPKYPNGQVVVIVSNEYRLADVTPELPYQTVDGDHRSGIEYFHWWRCDDRFFSRSFIEPMKDPQRLINETETMNREIIRRGMPKVFTREGDLPHNPAGLPLENIELKPDAKEPSFFAGIGPGAWMYEELAHLAENLAHASTLSALRLGENPANVGTYAQLAMLNENESVKRSMILQEHRQSIGKLIELGVYDIRKYWPEQKQINVSGDEGAMSRVVFQKSKLPDFYVVKPARGSSKPRSQGAELTKVDAIWNAAVACGIAVGPNAERWIEWYADSLNAGQAMELPEVEADSQTDMARFENFLMLEEGEDVEPADYDLLPAHIPVHREAQNQARASGDTAAFQRIATHIQASIALVQQNAMQVAQAQQVPSPLAPQAPPDAIPPQLPPDPGPQAAPMPPSIP